MCVCVCACLLQCICIQLCRCEHVKHVSCFFLSTQRSRWELLDIVGISVNLVNIKYGCYQHVHSRIGLHVYELAVCSGVASSDSKETTTTVKSECQQTTSCIFFTAGAAHHFLWFPCALFDIWINKPSKTRGSLCMYSIQL